MESELLSAALEREHREIDEGLAAFTSALADGALAATALRTEPLTRAVSGLRRHIYLEEKFLFPPLREAGMVAPIFVMVREHGQMWTTLDALDAEITNAATTASVLQICSELEAQLEDHNSKEEQIVYPQTERVLTAPASAELRAFLDSGMMPTGWVCEAAQAREGQNR